MTTRQRLWLTHRRREVFEACPLCGKKIKWVYNGIEWIPCDKDPIFCKFDVFGKVQIVKNKNLYDKHVVYDGGDICGFYRALLPHVYSCDELNGWHGIKIKRGVDG